LNKGLIGKISLFSLLFLAVIIALILNVNPVSSEVNPGQLVQYGNLCGGNMCPAWVNLTRGDMFFSNGDVVYVIANISCVGEHVCNSSMIVDANFSQIGLNQLRKGVFRQNGTAASWAIFEFNGTIDFTSLSVQQIQPKNITFNLSAINDTSGAYQSFDMPALFATILLVNMSVPPGCPPAGENLQIPSQVLLLNGTLVNTTSQCISTCTVDDVAQLNHTNSSGPFYNLCGPTFGGSTTNFTDVASNGNFSNFAFIIDILGKVKLNFTQNVSMDTQEKSQAIFQFAMKNMMSGGRVGINETEWGGADTTKPNLTLSAALTIYNFSGRFGIPATRRPSIARRATYGTGTFSPCPTSVCSGVTWDGQNLTFSVTGFSEYSVETGLSMILSNTTGQNFNSTINTSYSNTRNVNFSYIPTWNSTVSPQAVRLWGNFTGTWAANVTNTTALTNATPNYINRTVGADGPYLWNVVINDTTGGNDTNSANWTIVVDTVNSTWFTNQSSTPTNYSTTNLSQFNVTWNDTTSPISKVFITIRNSTGVLINNASMANTYGGSIYNYSLVLPAGTFNWTSYANDSANNWNASDTWTFTISNNTPDVKIFIDDLTNNKTINYSTSVTIKGNSSNTTTPPNFNLYVINVSTSPLVSLSNTSNNPATLTLTLGNGTYQVIYNTTGNANWSSTSNSTIFLLVNKGALNLSLSVPAVTYPSNTTATVTASNSGASDVNYTLYRNNSLVNFSTTNGTAPGGEIILLGNGTYNYTIKTVAGPFANWTENTTGITANVTVSKGTPSLVITGPSGWAVTYPTSATVLCTATSQNSEATAFLYRDGANVSSTTETVSSTIVAVFNYTCNSSATANYTIGQATPQLLTLSAASSTLGSSGSSGTSSTSSNVYITLGVGKATITSSSITTSGKLIATIAKYQDIAIRGMNITVVNNVANIKIIITKVNTLPSTVAFDISGKVYNYISVDEANFTDSDISKVNMTFAVNKTWLTNNNIDASNMTMYRWANNKWNDLGAIKVSEDTSEVFYTVGSPGLSVFVIGTKGVQAPAPSPTCTESWSCTDWSSCANSQQTRTCTDSNNCGTTSSKPAESQSCTPESNVTPPTSFPILNYVIVIVAIVVCVLIFLERNKITSYFQKSSKKKTQYVYKKPS
jgi:PGF-pre-PGF domain-containing protein